jgi:hypothetical protein
MIAIRVDAETRVALVSTCGGNAGEKVLALAEAKLSTEKDMALLERHEVERVLDEQKLTRCGLTDSAQALAVGKLLGVEVFATLETFHGSDQALGLAAFDAINGVRLCDVTLPTGRTEQVVDGVIAAVRSACDKRARTTGARHTICLLSVRNADLPHDLDSFCTAVGQVLEKRLLGSDSLTLLERERLEQVNRERALPTATQSGNLLPSLTVLDLEFARGGTGEQTKATALLSDTGGKQFDKLSITVDKRDAVAIAELLAAAVTKALQATPAVATVDRASEARRFCEESHFLSSRNEEDRATQAAETAYALDPEHNRCILELSSHLSTRARNVLAASHTRDRKAKQDNVNSALDLVMRSIDLDTRASGGDLKNEGPGGAGGLRLHWSKADFLSWLPNLDDCDERTRARWETFRKLCRSSVMAAMDPRQEAIWSTDSNMKGFLHYLRDFGPFLSRIEYFSPSSEAWTTDTVHVLGHFLELMERYDLCSVIDQEVSGVLINAIRRANERNLDSHDWERFRAMFEPWEHHTNEFIQLYGMAGQLAVEGHVQGWGTQAVQNRYEAIKQLTHKALASPTCAQADKYHVSLYQAALDAIGLMPDAKVRTGAIQELFDLMIGRRDFAYRVALAAVAEAPGRTPETRLKNTEAVLSLLNSSGCRYLGGLAKGLVTDQPQRATIHQQFAILEQQLRPPTKVTVPWSAAHLLFRASENGFSYILRPQLQGDAVLVVGLGEAQGQGKFAQLVRVPLNGGAVKGLGKINCDWKPRDFDRGTSHADGRFCWATSDSGIFTFPVNGDQPEHLGKAEGFPTDRLRSIACLEGKLYAGYGEGILSSYDWQTHEWKTITSNRGKDAGNPLHDVWQYIFRQMMADPPRHRVLFTVDFGLGSAGVPVGPFGLWALDTRSGKVTKLLALNWSCPWLSPVRSDKLLIDTRIDPGGASGIIQFDLTNNQAELLYVSGSDPELARRVQVHEHASLIPFSVYGPHLLVDGWLWSGDPFGRISADGKTHELFDAVPPAPHTPDPDNLTGYLELIENGTKVLRLADNNSLMILDLITNSPTRAVSPEVRK